MILLIVLRTPSQDGRSAAISTNFLIRINPMTNERQMPDVIWADSQRRWYAPTPGQPWAAIGIKF